MAYLSTVHLTLLSSVPINHVIGAMAMVYVLMVHVSVKSHGSAVGASQPVHKCTTMVNHILK